MEQDQVEGTARNWGGRVQDAAGALLGDAKMQAEGKAKQAYGAAQEQYGAAVDTIRSFAEEKPWAMIGMVAGAAFLLGLVLGRR